MKNILAAFLTLGLAVRASAYTSPYCPIGPTGPAGATGSTGPQGPSGSVSGSGIANYLPIWTSGSAQGSSLFYQANNAIGIGTTNPAATLHINGTVMFGGNPISLSYPFVEHVATNLDLGMRANGSSLELLSVNDTAGANEPMNLEGSPLSLNSRTGGNVGIGTASPSAALQVIGQAMFGTNTLNYPFTTNQATNQDLSFRANGTSSEILATNDNGSSFTPMNIEGSKIVLGTLSRSAGNVGIGTASPTDMFQVGNATFTVKSDGFVVINSYTKATLAKWTPAAADLGGAVRCTDCTNAYALMVATGTTLAGFREEGTTHGLQ